MKVACSFCSQSVVQLCGVLQVVRRAFRVNGDGHFGCLRGGLGGALAREHKRALRAQEPGVD